MRGIYDINSYDYELPEANIAQSPAEPRDNSRLLIWETETGKIKFNNIFRDIKEYLREGDLLILNDTKVIPARLIGRRLSGGASEIFLLRAKDDEYTKWEALVKPARKIHKGNEIEVRGEKIIIEEEKAEGIRIIKFNGMNKREEVMRFLNETGIVPLPPYINNNSKDIKEKYQTVFAEHEGSVAAPTASLHFTKELLKEIKAKGIKTAYVTLHVGLGTFRPVQVDDIREHVMHKEECEISDETARIINEVKDKGGRIIASGTTAARTLESFSEGNRVKSGKIETGIYIYPGYEFKIVDGLITNFHLPKSSLIMLVSAFIAFKSNKKGKEEGVLKELLEVYEESARRGWRFYSFGDAMFIS